MEKTKNKPDRVYYLDWLRVLTVFLFLFFHTARIFDSVAPFYIKSKNLCSFCDTLIFFLDQWQLPFLFFIAGAAACFSLRYRTEKEYIIERFKRLIVPFIFGVLIIVPPQLYFVLKSIPEYQESYLEFYSYYFFNINREYPLGGSYSGSFELAHLWFLAILFIFSFITLPFFIYFKQRREILSKITDFCNSSAGIFLLAVPLAVIEVIARALKGWSFFQNPFLYIAIFIYGFFLFSDERFKETIEKYGKTSLILAVVFSLILFKIGWKEIGFLATKQRYSFDFIVKKYIFESLRGINIWFWTLAVLYLGKRFMSFNNKVLQYFNGTVLPFFILHQTVIVGVGFYVIKWNISALAKFFFIDIFSLILIFLIYEVFIKRIGIMRFLFGMRLRERKALDKE